MATEEVSIKIRRTDGTEFLHQTSLDSTVRSFKIAIAHKCTCGLSPDQQSLLYGDHILNDDLTLRSYGLEDGGVLRLVLTLAPDNNTNSTPEFHMIPTPLHHSKILNNSHHHHHHQHLKVHKDSHNSFKKSSSAVSKPKPQPVIIYEQSPKVIHTHPKDFKTLVQKLTGPSPSKNNKKKKKKNNNHVTTSHPRRQLNYPATSSSMMMMMATDEVNIKIRRHDGTEFLHQTSLDSTIRKFNYAIAQKLGISSDQHLLIYGDHILNGDDLTLRSYGLDDGHVVHSVLRLAPDVETYANGGANGTTNRTRIAGANEVGLGLNGMNGSFGSNLYGLQQMRQLFNINPNSMGAPRERAMQPVNYPATSSMMMMMATDQVNIKIRRYDGTEFWHQASLDSTIGTFKYAIACKCGISPDQQRLIYGYLILNDDLTLRSYGLDDGHVVLLFLSLTPDSVTNGIGGTNVTTNSIRSASANEGGGLGLINGMRGSDMNGSFGSYLSDPQQMQQLFNINPNSMRTPRERAMQSLVNYPDLAILSVPPEQYYAAQLSQLEKMGFIDRLQIITALIATSGDVHAAAERLWRDFL